MNIKAARHRLGMSITEFAGLHRVAPQTVRRWEMAPDAQSYREPSGSALAFTQALLDGYRPKIIPQDP